jgi:hypothetical protein
LIVDDWNWREVRDGTQRAFAAIRCRAECSIEIRTNSNPFGKESDWHNGYFIAVVVKDGTDTSTSSSSESVAALAASA